MITWIIVFALALLSIVVFMFALRSQQDAEALEDRLAGTIDEEAAAHPHQAGGIEPLPEWIQPAARFGLKLAGNDKSRETTALLLAQAGFARPGSLGVFLLLKTLLGLGIAAALFFGTQERSIGTIALMGAGYFAGGILPEWVLKSMAARRYTALERSMPDALDLGDLRRGRPSLYAHCEGGVERTGTFRPGSGSRTRTHQCRTGNHARTFSGSSQSRRAYARAVY